MAEPVLVDTTIACLFIVKLKRQDKTAETLKAAREHVYYLSTTGQLTRHGGSTRGSALWDLRELANTFVHVNPPLDKPGISKLQ